MERHQQEVPPDRLRNELDPESLPFDTTEELEPLVGTMGQDRAVSAIEFGLDIRTFGYNMYISGPVGAGKNTTVLAYLRRMAADQSVPPDWCYIHNFTDPYRPDAISLPPGRGSELARDMEELVASLKVDIPRAFESEGYEQRKHEIGRELSQQRESISTALQNHAREQGFNLEATPVGIVTVPTVEGRPLSREDYEGLSDEAKNEIHARSEQLRHEIEQALARIRRLEKDTTERIRQLDQEIANFAIGHLFDDLQHRYADHPAVEQFLSQARLDVMEHLEEFRSPERESVPIPGLERLRQEEIFNRYRVNVIVDNRDQRGAPIVLENNPTYYNLLGRLDYRGQLGVLTTDFNMIRTGAIQRANGGYLVVQARDVLTSPFSWEALKRSLRSREARIENLGEQFTALPMATLKPEPIPIDVKVVMVGSPYLYYLLSTLDEDFRKLFRAKADFDIEMKRTREHISDYARFIGGRCRELGLRHFDRTGVAKVIEYSSRLREHQDKLSARFIDVADVVSESSYWASKDGSRYVRAEHVTEAVRQKVYRSNLIEEKMRDLITEGTLLIDTGGTVPAQVNGIAIHQWGDYSFGKPTRITARVALGSGGVVNIEREVKMGGRIHNKGFYILVGYLVGKYAQDKPLALWGSIGFEQTYDEIDGDSASSTELYALISALSGVPLRQHIAVTGSVNQRGDIQAVGGVIHKIEGFFDVCRSRGLSGDQGVMIPEANVRHLMLREDVVQAVREGLFHVYAVETIDQGLEVLTGMPAGERRRDGSWEENTINYLVDKQLREYAEKARHFDRHVGGPSSPRDGLESGSHSHPSEP